MTAQLAERVAWAMAHIGVRGGRGALEQMAAGQSVDRAARASRPSTLIDTAARDEVRVRPGAEASQGRDGEPRVLAPVLRGARRARCRAAAAVAEGFDVDVSAPMELLDDVRPDRRRRRSERRSGARRGSDLDPDLATGFRVMLETAAMRTGYLLRRPREHRSDDRGARRVQVESGSTSTSASATSSATARRRTSAATSSARPPRSRSSATTTPPSPAGWTTRTTTTPLARRSTSTRASCAREHGVAARPAVRGARGRARRSATARRSTSRSSSTSSPSSRPRNASTCGTRSATVTFIGHSHLCKSFALTREEVFEVVATEVRDPARAQLHHLGRLGRPAARLRQPRELHDLRHRRAHASSSSASRTTSTRRLRRSSRAELERNFGNRLFLGV